MSLPPDVTIDLSGLACPAPLLGAKKVLDDLAPGQSLQLVSDCSGTHEDLLAWCNHTGHSLVSTAPAEGGKTVYLLRKTGGKPIPHALLDMRGIACPGPIIEAKRLLQRMGGGEILQLVTDCTAAVDDVPAWGDQASIDLLYQREVAGGAHEFYLRKL
ncbi:MAG: sulfurtransferase TusA family protein [Rhodocyclaceae bacterium]|jgi:tRNA 2-thiouridine synthesizing protein A|nr:sulfurtransferase TusA family protein [Rhodocyclaceae bacterium]